MKLFRTFVASCRHFTSLSIRTDVSQNSRHHLHQRGLCLQNRNYSISNKCLQHQIDSDESEQSSRDCNVPSTRDKNGLLKHPDFFRVKKLVTVEDLFNARVHYGHKKGSRNEHMKRYLYGCRLGVDIIDLDQTLLHLHRALNFLAHMAYRKAILLFIMQSTQFGHLVDKLALDCQEYAHTRSWTQGTFTNINPKILKNLRLPDVCVFLSTQGAPYRSHEAVAEAAKLGIVSVGVCDSNVNPTLISYPIPGNDDTADSIKLYCRLFQEAVLLGKEARKKTDDKAL